MRLERLLELHPNKLGIGSTDSLERVGSIKRVVHESSIAVRVT